ncbi:MAG TPA: 5-carboxymethyl-2-hydroxymuconate isomerase [Gammaproteobacteria bacterium]
MPHLTIEYSANLEGRLDLDGLLDVLYRAALETGVFPLGGIRVRAHRADHYRIADCDPANAFVHVTALIGHGRPLDVRRRAGEHLFAALTDCLEPLYAEGPLAISFHVEESHPDLNFKKNNLHRYVAERKERAQGGASNG